MPLRRCSSVLDRVSSIDRVARTGVDYHDDGAPLLVADPMYHNSGE